MVKIAHELDTALQQTGFAYGINAMLTKWSFSVDINDVYNRPHAIFKMASGQLGQKERCSEICINQMLPWIYGTVVNRGRIKL